MTTSQNNHTNLICTTCKHEWNIEGNTIAKSVQCPICNSLHWSKRALPETNEEKASRIIKFDNWN